MRSPIWGRCMSFDTWLIGLTDQFRLTDVPAFDEHLAHPVEDRLSDLWPAGGLRTRQEGGRRLSCLLHDDARLDAGLNGLPRLRVAEGSLQSVTGNPSDVTGERAAELDDQAVSYVGGEHPDPVSHFLLQFVATSRMDYYIIPYLYIKIKWYDSSI